MNKIKIYIASSWKNENFVLGLSNHLRDIGYNIDAFADSSKGRYVFNFSDIKNLEKFNTATILNENEVRKAFNEDKKWLDWCDCLILLLPAGNSSHLEAGYIKGQGKKLIIYNPSGLKSDFDVMYGFADLITDNLSELIECLYNLKEINGQKNKQNNRS